MSVSLVERDKGFHPALPLGALRTGTDSVWTRPAREVLSHLESQPTLCSLLSLSTRVREGYTVGQHTEMVLNQEGRYLLGFAPEQASSVSADRVFFRKILAAHDLAKFLPNTPVEGWEAGKEAQGLRTAAVLDTHLDFFELSRDELRIAKFVITSEFLPTLLRSIASNVRLVEEKQRIHALLTSDDGGAAVPHIERAFVEMMDKIAANVKPRENYEPHIDATVREFTQAAVLLEMPPSSLWDLAVRYFQCDASAYTFEAQSADRRGVPSLEFLFRMSPLAAVFRGGNLFIKHTEAPRLLFADPFEPVVSELYDRLR